jgi:hypothetical protein
MNFGDVLAELKSGKCAARAGWVLGTEIFLVEGSTFAVNRAPLNKIFSEGAKIKYSAHIDMLLPTQGVETRRVQVWTPTTDDILAEDWVVVA